MNYTDQPTGGGAVKIGRAGAVCRIAAIRFLGTADPVTPTRFSLQITQQGHSISIVTPQTMDANASGEVTFGHNLAPNSQSVNGDVPLQATLPTMFYSEEVEIVGTSEGSGSVNQIQVWWYFVDQDKVNR